MILPSALVTTNVHSSDWVAWNRTESLSRTGLGEYLRSGMLLSPSGSNVKVFEITETDSPVFKGVHGVGRSTSI